MISAADDLSVIASCIEAGADDFLPKPFEITELEARLVALIRRSRGSDHPRFACGALAYDSATRQFVLDGEALSLSPREHAVLRALIQRSGEPLSKREISERVFSDDEDVQPEVIEVLIHRLRKRLEHKSVRVVTVRGLGYLLETA
jgi:two-component system response regulator TctD